MTFLENVKGLLGQGRVRAWPERFHGATAATADHPAGNLRRDLDGHRDML
jgi:hypothetical protein